MELEGWEETVDEEDDDEEDDDDETGVHINPLKSKKFKNYLFILMQMLN